MSDKELKDVLEYALGGSAPPGFLDHLLRHRGRWDAAFRQALDRYACELRPDLVIWEIAVNDDGTLRETRLPLVPALPG